MAAAWWTITNDTDLGGDTRHGIGVTDDADLLALGWLQHGERVDNRLKGIMIEGTKAFVNEQILERDVSWRKGWEA